MKIKTPKGSKGYVIVAIKENKVSVKTDITKLNRSQLKALISNLEIFKINAVNKFLSMEE